MTEAGKKPAVDVEAIKSATEKYKSGQADPTPAVIADLTKALHDLSDHIASLRDRVDRIEDTHDEWTARGWVGPPGSEIPPG